MKQRFKQLMARYGRLFVVVYVLLTIISYAGFFEAIGLTFQAQGVEGAGEGVWSFFGAWLASKATQPLRILLAVVITRAVAPLVWRLVPSWSPADAG